jgi:OMF family outer membrane factor
MKNSQWCPVVLVVIFSMAWPFAGLAQEARSLNLHDAIELALKNNRQLQAAEQYKEAARSMASQARGAFFPRVDIIEAFNYSDKPTLVFSNLLDQSSFKQQNFAINSLNNPTPLTNLASQLRLEQPLYTGGKLSANLGQATAFAEASEETARRTRQETIASVTEAYYRVLLAEGDLEVINKSLTSAGAHLERTKDLFAKGLAVRADVLRTQVLVGSFEREKMQAENAIAVSRTQLQYLLGEAVARYRLTEQPSTDELPIEELDRLVSTARRSRPDVKAAEKEVARAKEIVRVAQADYYPVLSFITQVESNTRKFTSSAENFAVFVNARWNLFNGFATQEKVVEAQALMRRAELLRDDLMQVVAKEVEQLRLGLNVARRQVGVARENVAQGEESLRILQDRYHVGLARNVDVLDSEAALKQAEHDLLRAQINSQIFRARLNLATGQL